MRKMKNGQEKPMLTSWKSLKTREVFSDPPWIRLNVDEVELPSGRVVKNFYQLQAADHVSIVVLTASGKLIMERQYKHGIRSVGLMIPGGAIDKEETVIEAAKRELLEETGYKASHWEELGSFVMDANHRLATANIVLAREAIKIQEPRFDDMEEVRVELMDPYEVEKILKEGGISILSAATALLLGFQRLSSLKEEIKA